MSEGKKKNKKKKFPKIKGLAEKSEGVSGNTRQSWDRHAAARRAGRDGQD